MIRAPWTDDQVAKLNRYQAGGWMHPFTCYRCRNRDIQRPLRHEYILVATNDGWVCPTCDYTQNWAHDFMLDDAPETWKAMFDK